MKALTRTSIIFGVAAALGIWLIPRVSDYPIDRIEAAMLVAFGLVVGAYGTIIGAGGGFLIVPVLLLVWHLPPAQAAGTSLVVVFLNAAAGSIANGRQKRIDFKSGLWFAAATLPGAVAGAFLAEYVSGRAFAATFGTVMLLVALLLLWKPVRSERRPASDETRGTHREMTDTAGNSFKWSFSLPAGLAISVGIGFLSSALGIGGGIFHVPAMIHVLFFPAVIATATSQFILAFSSLVGGATHLSLGNVLFGPAALMGIGVVAGAQVGSTLAKKIRGAAVVRLLSLALIVVAARLLARAL